MAMILTPPGLQNIPCRNFPSGTLGALAVHPCSLVRTAFSTLAFTSSGQERQFSYCLIQSPLKTKLWKVLTSKEENTYIHTMYIPVHFLKGPETLQTRHTYDAIHYRKIKNPNRISCTINELLAVSSYLTSSWITEQ